MKDINYKQLDVTSDGDFNLLNDTLTLNQDENIILNSNKGNILTNLLLGVGIFKYLNGPISGKDKINMNRDIKTELKKEGIIVHSIQTINGQIYIDASDVTI